MVLLLAELTAKANCAATVEEILRGLARAAGTEAGNVHYAVHRHTEKPEVFVVYELYRDEAACQAHLSLPHVQAALQQFEALLAAPPHIVNATLLARAEHGSGSGA